MQRQFGVEIECYNVKILDNWIQNLIDTYDLSYESDPSINGAYSVELQTPPWKYNERNIQFLRQIVRGLKENAAKVNRSCGLHVHVDVQDIVAKHKGDFLKFLSERYAANEQEYSNKLVKASRNRNHFCKSNERLSFKNVSLDFKNINRAMILDFDYLDRYYKLNVSSFPFLGTVEFRQHHGSLDEDEVVNWVKYCVNFVNTSEQMFKDATKRRRYFKNPMYKLDREASRYLKNKLNKSTVSV